MLHPQTQTVATLWKSMPFSCINSSPLDDVFTNNMVSLLFDDIIHLRFNLLWHLRTPP